MEIKVSKLTQKLISMTWMLWLFFVVAYSDKITIYANTCALVIMGLIGVSIVIDHSLYIPKQLFWLIAFGLFAVISILWSLDFSTSITRVKTTWRMILLLLLMTNYMMKLEDRSFIYKDIEIAGNAVAIYTVIHYGVAGLLQMINAGYERVGGDFVNENTLGIFLATSAAITLYQVVHRKEYKRIAFMLLPLVISLMTASKKVILILAISIAYVALREMSKSSATNKIRTLVLTLVFIMVFIYLYQSPLGAVMQSRMQGLFGESGNVDSSTQIRMNMVEAGIEQFKSTPVVGCGIGASTVLTGGTYLHNNYVEMLATGGVVGFILYYGFYLACFSELRRATKCRREISDIALLLMMICVVTDIGSVSYFSKAQYMNFIVIMAGIVEREYSIEKEGNYNETTDGSYLHV